MEPTITIVNTVVSTKLAADFDLEKLMETGLEGAVYNKETSPGLRYRIKDPDATFLIFAFGDVVCTGTKSIEKVHTAMINLLLTSSVPSAARK